jgi:tRNA(Ile)-lysidine synthase
VPFVDDPSNEDPKFDRARARAALAEIGIGTDDPGAQRRTPGAGPGGADRARRERGRRGRAADRLRHVLRIDRDGFAGSNATRSCGFSPPPCNGSAARNTGRAPRRWRPCSTARLAGGGGTLHGAQVEVTRDEIEVFREFAAVRRGRGARGPVLAVGRIGGRSRADIKGIAFVRWATRAGGRLPEPLRPPTGPRPTRSRAPCRRFSTGDRLVGCPCASARLGVAELRPPQGHFLALLNPH